MLINKLKPSGRMVGKIISVVPPTPSDLAKWIGWLLQQAAGENPGEDKTGESAAQSQGKEDVWFLAGGYGNSGTINRNAIVPAESEILIISASSDASLAEHGNHGLNPNDPEIDKKLKEIAKAVAHKHIGIELTIIPKADKNAIKSFKINDPKQQSELQLIETNVIPIIFPPDNVYKVRYKVKGGLTRLSCVGWGVKVKLEPGEYTVILKAKHPPAEIKAGGITFQILEFNLDIKYELTAISGFKSQTLKFG
jgi:hypothetical protein